MDSRLHGRDSPRLAPASGNTRLASLRTPKTCYLVILPYYFHLPRIAFIALLPTFYSLFRWSPLLREAGFTFVRERPGPNSKWLDIRLHSVHASQMTSARLQRIREIIFRLVPRVRPQVQTFLGSNISPVRLSVMASVILTVKISLPGVFVRPLPELLLSILTLHVELMCVCVLCACFFLLPSSPLIPFIASSRCIRILLYIPRKIRGMPVKKMLV